MSEFNLNTAFEAWFRKDRSGFEPHMLAWFEDHYVNEITQSAWCGWVAACKHLEGLGAVRLRDTEVAGQ